VIVACLRAQRGFVGMVLSHRRGRRVGRTHRARDLQVNGSQGRTP
jgi:hypothetical protein